MIEDMRSGEQCARTVRFLFVAIAIAAPVIFAAMAVIRVIYPQALSGLNSDVMQQHWPAVFGIPLCALLALFVVLLTTTMSGENFVRIWCDEAIERCRRVGQLADRMFSCDMGIQRVVGAPKMIVKASRTASACPL